MENNKIINTLENILDEMRKIEYDKTSYNSERNAMLYARAEIIKLIFNLKGINF